MLASRDPVKPGDLASRRRPDTQCTVTFVIPFRSLGHAPMFAIMLGVGAGAVGVAALRRPLADAHHAAVRVPGGELRLRDAQLEHDRLPWRVRRPRRLSRPAKTWIGLHGASVQLELAVAAAWAADNAVQRVPRIPAQVRGFPDHVMAPASSRPSAM